MGFSEAFAGYESNIVGQGTNIVTPQGEFSLLYADYAASGRLYGPIQDRMTNTFGPYVANTHTETNTTGQTMTQAYHHAKYVIKEHVGANSHDVAIMSGSGMTSAVTLFQRILGWRCPERFKGQISMSEVDRPEVYVSELEHHSNHTSWLETIAKVVVVPGTERQPIDLDWLKQAVTNSAYKTKVAAVTAASNVTGIRLPVHDIAEIMHGAGGLSFVDYTCAAPYDSVNMHLSDEASADAIYFSPHKFLGGPGTPGVLIFNEALYENTIPDRPGGGTVTWTNPWGGRCYYDDIETREDGGTPPFLQTIQAALAVRLKESMGTVNIAGREKEITHKVFTELGSIAGLTILAGNNRERLPVFSFTIEGLQHNLVTRLLNDFAGVQVRGGCACAGTYGHKLFGIDPLRSKHITDRIDAGDLSLKPGFVRASFHPTMSESTVDSIVDAIKLVSRDGHKMAKDYILDPSTNEYNHKDGNKNALSMTEAFLF